MRWMVSIKSIQYVRQIATREETNRGRKKTMDGLIIEEEDNKRKGMRIAIDD